MVSIIRIIVVSMFILTLLSAISGLWIYHSYISPLRGLAEKPSIGDILDKVTKISYTMTFNGEIYIVEVSNNPTVRSGFIRLTYSNGSIVEYTFNYTKNLVLIRILKPQYNTTLLNPREYGEAFATNIRFIQDQGGNVIGVEPFPGIAPLYALHYIGNATLIDWESLYNPRAQHRPQNIQYLFTTINLGGETYRGVEILIQPLYNILTQTLKWYSVEVHAKIANIRGIVTAGELTINIVLRGEIKTIEIKLENIEFKS
ncbi:MAG: hypothetical protein QXL49_01155 [Acidilobaceae archaeon]